MKTRKKDLSKWVMTAVALFAAVACTPFTPSDGVDDENLEELTMEYTIRQKRSAKRGLSAHLKLETDLTLIADGVGWYYNWGTTVNFINTMKESNILFYPMAWNLNFNADAIRSAKSVCPDAEYILAYNEPNLVDQANCTPAEAASRWGELKALAAELNMKLTSPALNYGTKEGYHDPIVWLDEFLAQPNVSLDDMDVIALHCYMPTGEALKQFIRRFDKYGKPIFMTEFSHANGAISNNVAQQQTFMSDALNYMESDDKVAGYAWFMNRASGNWSAISIVNSDPKNPALTDLGEEYVHFSTFDKECYYPTGEAFPAAHYRSNNAEAGAEGTTWEKSPAVKASTDVTGPVALYDFFGTQMWVEYGIEVAKSGTYDLLVRYSNLTDGNFTFTIDGNEVSHLLPNTGSESSWKTSKVEGFELSKGKHILRVSLTKGRANFNWMCFRKTN